MDTNIKPGEPLKKGENYYFIIDDKLNQSYLDQNIFKKFFGWTHGVEPLNEDLKKIQYLEFHSNSLPFYVCICSGINDTYCFINIFPNIKSEWCIQGCHNLKDDYYEEEFWITFR